MAFLGNTCRRYHLRNSTFISESALKWAPSSRTFFNSHFFTHFYENFWCLFVTLCLPRFPPIPHPQRAATAAGTAPPASAFQGLFFTPAMVNEAGVTGQWLDNEFILQPHREQGTSLPICSHGSGSAVCKESPAELLMCSRAWVDGPCKASSAKKWEETELWDYFRAVAGND